MKLLPLILLFAQLVLLTGCTGQWVNDGKNWDRAYGGEPPEGVTVLHSLYWRTKYTPQEDGWVIELKLSPERRRLLFEQLKLRTPKADDESTIGTLKKDPPSWFLPKPMTRYATWIGETEPGNYSGAFEDKESGIFFVVAVRP